MLITKHIFFSVFSHVYSQIVFTLILLENIARTSKKKKPSKLRVVMWNVINARMANNWGRSFLYELAKEGLSEEERDLS